MDENDINKLADALALKLGGKVTVEVARMHRTGKDKPMAYVDLLFTVAGHAVGTVYGFKLMAKGDGGRWLAVPQTRRQGTGGEGEPPAKWEDRFTWGSKAVQTEAERVVKAMFDLEVAAEAPKQQDEDRWPE